MSLTRLQLTPWAFAVFTALITFSPPVHANETLYIYGPGGPSPAMHATAKAFTKRTGIEIDVTAGPMQKWSHEAKENADLIYSGSEAMMSDFLAHFSSILRPSTVQPLYLRPAGILVRPGNPKHITGLATLLRPGMHVMVVHGAGQVGMWEDIAGRTGEIQTIRALRANIVRFAPNSGVALKIWKDDPLIDAWIIFPIWAIAHPGLADVVPLEAKYRVYRDCGIALTRKGEDNSDIRKFVMFLTSREGKKIFNKFGWTDRATL